MDDLRDIYAQLAPIVNIEGITSDANADILCRIRDNDSDLDTFVMCDEEDREDESASRWLQYYGTQSEYCPSPGEDLAWAGHFISNSANLRHLIVHNLTMDESNDSLDKFFRGVSRNRSIQDLNLQVVDLADCHAIETMMPFFHNNTNLREILIERCDVGADGDRLLSSMIRKCQNLERLDLINTLDWQAGGATQPKMIIASLGEQSKLKKLFLKRMGIRSTGCVSLSLLSNLEKLSLIGNDIGDYGVVALRGAVENGSSLRVLNLSHNPDITVRGYKSIAGMLKSSKSNLERLTLLWNNVDDERANILASALGNGCTLKRLVLVAADSDVNLAETLGIEATDNIISQRGWRSFEKALCNTASIESTHDSNHTLVGLARNRKCLPQSLPCLLRFSLRMNGVYRLSKGTACLRKIQKYHLGHDAAMRLFSDMDRSVLPYFIARVPKGPPKGVRWKGVCWPLQLLYWCVRNLPSQFGRGILLDGSAAKWLDPRAFTLD